MGRITLRELIYGQGYGGGIRDGRTLRRWCRAARRRRC